METKEFVEKALELCEKYRTLHNVEGVLGVDELSIHIRAENFFAYFPKETCQRMYHSDLYPTRYSVYREGVEFFCLTEEPFVEDVGGVIK